MKKVPMSGEPVSYTQIEERVIEGFEGRRGEELTTEEVAGFAYPDGEFPKSWETSLRAILRNLRYKMIAEGRSPIQRVSPLGRGNSARYRFGAKKE